MATPYIMPLGFIDRPTETGATFIPNPPKDRDGRREDTGRGVRKLQKRWSGLEFG